MKVEIWRETWTEQKGPAQEPEASLAVMEASLAVGDAGAAQRPSKKMFVPAAGLSEEIQGVVRTWAWRWAWRIVDPNTHPFLHPRAVKPFL